MKKKFRSIYFIITSIVIYLAHLPSALAKMTSPADSLKSHDHAIPFMPGMKSVYDSLQLGLSGLSKQAFEYAKKGMEKLRQQGQVINDSIISIIDFSQSSDKKRLYVLDLKNYRVLFNTLVAHGRNSGREWASSFSNRPSSKKSSAGFYVTGDIYDGKNGLSLKLEGVERGINDKAYERAIVLHGAGYVSQDYVDAQGFIGRSEGCPAVPVEEAPSIINTIKGGACLFIYTPEKAYLTRSAILH